MRLGGFIRLLLLLPTIPTILLASTASAEYEPVIVAGDETGVYGSVRTPGSPGGIRLAQGYGRAADAEIRTDPCEYAPMGAFPLVLNPAPGVNLDPHAGEPGAYWFHNCPGASGIDWVPAGRAGPAVAQVTPAGLAQQASSLLPLPNPVPRTAPDRSDQPGLAVTVVNIHTWLWLDRSSWGTRTRTTAVPGLRVTVTATPVRADWDLGEGRSVSCGPGTPWRPGGAGADDGFGPPSPDCDYRFARGSGDGAYQATVQSVWRVSWQASDGEQGGLPDLTRTTGFQVGVREFQAVLVG